MKKIIILLLILLLASCETMHVKWALNNGYIKAEDCPTIPDVPERQALPHPTLPIFETVDYMGNPIKITEFYLMDIVIQLFGTVEKFQYLVEIYEREYLNVDGKIMPNLTIEELTKLYKERIGVLKKTFDPMTDATGSYYQQLTIEEFEFLLKEWNKTIRRE